MLELKLREEFRGKRLKGTAIELSNDTNTGATQIAAKEFLEITYPTHDLLKGIEAVGPNQGRPVVVIGERGLGKSHLMAALYHAVNDATSTGAWLNSWRLHLRDGMPIKEIARTLGLPRNTVKRWLRSGDMKVPAYPKRTSPSKLDAYKEVLAGWLKLNAHRNKRERKSVTTMTEGLRVLGYGGSHSQVARFVRRWKAELGDPSRRAAFVPLKFPQGDAAQFDWSTEYVWIGGLRRRVSAAYMKLCCSRAFVTSA